MISPKKHDNTFMLNMLDSEYGVFDENASKPVSSKLAYLKFTRKQDAD